MDYERKYKLALERARGLLEGMDEGDYFASNGDIENIFPELKESKDERIRREIIEYITLYKDSLCDKEYNSWIAWLEKQGENKKLDADKVIEWLKPYSVIVDNITDEFKKEFGL